MQLFLKLIATAKGVASHPLHSQAKLRAIWRFACTQMAARLVPGELAVPFPNQTRLLVPPRMKGAAHFIWPGLCEFEPMSFVAHFLRPEELFVDVGANLGAYTLLASGVAGARSIPVEPSPSSFAYLLQTIRLNQLQEKTNPIQAALGSAPGTLHLTEGLGTENYLCPDNRGQDGIQVPVTTLDLLLATLDPALIKIDVEGYESEVIAGAQQILRRPSLQGLIIERAENATRYGFDESQLHHQLRALGFAPCSYAPFSRTLSLLSPHAQGNLIYLKDTGATQERLQRAQAFQFGSRRI